MAMRDRAQEIRNKAKRYIDKNSIQAALDAQLVDGDNKVLDTRETIFGNENPGYLEPLDPKLKVRSKILFGFFRKNGQSKFKFTTWQTSDNKLARAWNQVPFFRHCQSFGIVKEDSATEMRLNASTAEATTSIFKAVAEELDITKIITDTIGKQFTSIAAVPEHYKDYKDAWDRKIFVRGVVSWINLDRPTPWNAVWVGLMDSEEGLEGESQVRILVPEHIAIDFGEGSEVIVFGKTRQQSWIDKDTDEKVKGDVTIDVFGIYPIPGLTTPKEPSVETLEDEEEVIGWID